MFSEFQIRYQDVMFGLSNTTRIGIGISTLKISVFFSISVLVSVSGIGKSEKYWYRWIICIRQGKISLLVV